MKDRPPIAPFPVEDLAGFLVTALVLAGAAGILVGAISLLLSVSRRESSSSGWFLIGLGGVLLATRVFVFPLLSDPEGAPAPVAPAAEPPSTPSWPTIPEHLGLGLGIAAAVIFVIVVVVVVVKSTASGRRQRREALAHDRRVDAEALAQRTQTWTHTQAEDGWLIDRMAEWDTDLGKLLEFPVMQDLSEPASRKLAEAMIDLQGARPADLATVPAKVNESHPYLRAVTRARVALTAAEANATKVRDRHFTTTERKQLRQARHILAMVMDSAATPAFREVQYRKVRELVDNLITVPAPAMARIEASITKQITAA